ncbi:hypothetical protein Acsp03_28400 [Actinomadura sp. NBRC 104412]|uniref:hypothetical protein n=1 Tax=Actinomadura sp. NBRC 104412 TaxID=3032203 RepID=UPI0024A5D29F|nr:hypothetical protein [Actinomadura sp. NBRC 104412]GLZ05374.1 hypothetical protein Acsp03_28400 [Actinomadura sp. NBRC 104412]
MGLFGRRRTDPAAGAAPTIDPCVHDPAAADLYEALRLRDRWWADDFLQAVTDPDERAFYLSVCASVPGLQDWIGTWTRAEPRSTLPLLVRGAHALNWAWEARSEAYAAHGEEHRFPGFSERLELAEACLGEVAARDPGETAAWTFLLACARGGRVKPDEARRRFERVVELHPGHLRAHTEMQTYLCERWYGSHEEMFAFARASVSKAAPGSPLGRLVADAHVEVWRSLPAAQAQAYITQEEVRADLRAAADHSIRHPAYRPQVGWPEVHNAFAFAFALAGDLPAAKEEFQLIGDCATRFPWEYLGQDPAAAFMATRDRVLSEGM